jgi:hypothetical protein
MKIIAITALQQFSQQLSELEKLVDAKAVNPLAYVLAKESLPIKLFKHHSDFFEALQELSVFVPDIKVWGDENIIISEIPLLLREDEIPYFMGIETTGEMGLGYKVHGDSIILSEYNATLFINALVNTFKYNAKYSRAVVYDDEHLKEHFLFKVGDEWWVLKVGDTGNWLHIYNSFDEAVMDYMTVDYGWKNWSPLQAQELKVKPKRKVEFPCFSTLILRFIEKYGISRLEKAKIVKLNHSLTIRKFIEKRGTIGEWIVDCYDAIAPNDAEDFNVALSKCLPSKLMFLEKEKEKVNEEVIKVASEIKKIEEMLVAYVIRGYDGSPIGVIGGLIVLFNDPKPNVGDHVVLLEYQERTSQKGKKYIKCFKWVKHPHPKLAELKKRYEELRNKEKALEKEIEKLAGVKQ